MTEAGHIARYRAFISYSHADEAHARDLHRWLERYRVPRALVESLGLDSDVIRPIFRDRDELRAAGSLPDVLRAALDDSAFLIVLCSSASASSHWVDQEIRYFKARRGAERVLCAIVDGDGPVDALLAEALRFDVDADGTIDRTRPREPLAADLRRSGDGRRRGYLKIAAGLLGTSLDALVQRHQARRMRVLAGAATASLVGMLLMAGLALYAFQQRGIALTEAETSRQVVDFLVGLFEVSNPTTQNPRTITALEILERGADEIRDSLETRPEVKGVLLTTMGEVYYNLGLYDESRELLETGMGLFAPGSLRALGARTALANVATRVADYDAAEAVFAEVVAQLEREHPDAVEARARAELGWGTLMLYSSRHAEAEVHYLRAADSLRGVAGAEPLLAKCVEGLANVYTDNGRHADAERLLLEAIAIKEASLGRNHVDTAATYHNLAVLRIDMGRFEAALADVQRALEIFVRVLGPEHSNVAMARMTLGRLLHAMGDVDAGVASLEQAVALGDRAYGGNNLFNAVSRVYFARALASARRFDDALRVLDDARPIYVGILGDDDTYLGDLLVNRAAIQDAAGDSDGARASCDEGLARLDRTGEAGLRATFGRECDELLARGAGR